MKSYLKSQKANGKNSLPLQVLDWRSLLLGIRLFCWEMLVIRFQVCFFFSLSGYSACACENEFNRQLLWIGAFGSGAAFALGDGWILARALEYAYNTLQLSRGSADENNKTNSIDTKAIIPEALSIFDEIRSPYYLRM